MNIVRFLISMIIGIILMVAIVACAEYFREHHNLLYLAGMAGCIFALPKVIETCFTGVRFPCLPQSFKI